MFIRNRKKPLTLQKLDALIPRLNDYHQKLPTLKESAAKLQKGYNGERRLDYYLRSLPSEFSVLNDVSLKLWNRQIQIDSLIISPHSIYMIEMKNFEGTLTFDTHQRQLIQTTNQIEKSFTYPLTQADNAVYTMMQWLQHYRLPSIPINSYIALAQPSTIVRVQGDEAVIAKYVMKAEEAALRIIQTEKTYAQTTNSNVQRRNQITNKIMEYVHDFSIDIINEYGIKENEIKPGTKCLNCGDFRVKYYQGKWTCPQCKTISLDAHDTTLNDFFLLYKNDINIREAMYFLGLDNRHTTYRILKKSNLIYQQKTKSWMRKPTQKLLK